MISFGRGCDLREIYLRINPQTSQTLRVFRQHNIIQLILAAHSMANQQAGPDMLAIVCIVYLVEKISNY